MRSLVSPLIVLAMLGASSAGGVLPSTPTFSPENFFSGRTDGTGTLKVMFAAPHGVRVHSNGRVTPDGLLILSQNVQEEGKPARDREWRIRRTGSATFGGSLSDATGPVRGDVAGNVLHLRYPMKGMVVEQWIALAPGGRSAHNRMTVRKFGMTVATLEETIRKSG